MTIRKADIRLSVRLTSYVSREQGAAEIQVSPSTWDEMVECGQLPPPCRFGPSGNILRWRWADVDESLRSRGGIADKENQQEPYFRERTDGTAKNR